MPPNLIDERSLAYQIMSETKLPPYPSTPKFLRRMKLIFRPLEYLEDYGREYGDFFAVGSRDTPFVYVNHPQAVQTIFSVDSELCSTAQRRGFINLLLGDNSILCLDGASHQQQRKLLMPPFHGDRLKTYGQLICQITQETISSWQVGKSFGVRSAMQEITLKVILQAVFGLQGGERCDRLKQLLASLLDSLGSPLTSSFIFLRSLQKDWGKWSPWGRFLYQKAEIDRLLYQEIQERREKNQFDGEDILTLLMLARDENDRPMSDRELRDELMTLLLAGHETTASALTWALYWVHYLPEVEAKLRSELSNAEKSLTPNEIARLPYLNAVCQESLRIYPIASTTFPRILKAPLDLMEYHFPVGTILAPCIYLIHHREDIYPEPDRFKPERFLARQFSPYEYFPFGGGTRRCIGMALAMLEMKLVLATVLSHCQLVLSDRRPLKPVRRALAMAPPSSFRIVLTSKDKEIEAMENYLGNK